MNYLKIIFNNPKLQETKEDDSIKVLWAIRIDKVIVLLIKGKILDSFKTIYLLKFPKIIINNPILMAIDNNFLKNKINSKILEINNLTLQSIVI